MLESEKRHHRRVLDGISKLERRLPFRFAVLQRLLDRHMTRLLARHDMPLASYRILITIEAFGEASPAELTRYTVVDKAQVSRVSADLERAGLIEARPHAKTPRRKWLRLTAAGSARLDGLMPDVDRRLDRLTSQFENGELEHLVKALEKLTGYVAAELERGQPDT